MALPDWPQGALQPSLEITWYRNGTTTPEPLTDATLSGYIRHRSTTVAIAGALVVTDAENGVFRWDLDEDDVATSGRAYVQFVATFPSGHTPAKTFQTQWTIKASLD